MFVSIGYASRNVVNLLVANKGYLMPVKRKYVGPYIVARRDHMFEILFHDQSLIPKRTYEWPQAAYRYAKRLNVRWSEEQKREQLPYQSDQQGA